MKLIAYLLAILLVCVPNLAKMHKNYLIDEISVNKNNLQCQIHPRFARKFLNEKTISITYDDEVNLKGLDEETLSAPFILSVISLVWASNETYYVKALDRNLADSLKVVKEVYKVLYPQITWEGKLIADTISTKNLIHTPGENLMMMCFSGGLDSTYTSLALNHKSQMLVTIDGFSQESNQERWPTIKQQVTNFANRYGKKTNHFIRSNFREIITGQKLIKLFPKIMPWREFCQEALSLFGICIPLMTVNNCTDFIIPSSADWSKPYPWGSLPFIDDNLRFKNMNVTHHDFTISRLEKVNEIVNMTKCGMEKPILHTCRHSEEFMPCALCHKSVMTINFLLVNEENPQDYGYPITRLEAMQKSQELFRQQYPFNAFDAVHISKWEDIQRQAANVINENETDQELKDYCSWLINLDFKKYKLRQKYWHIPFERYHYFLDEDWRKEFLKKLPLKEI